jgi:hypothetical protein
MNGILYSNINEDPDRFAIIYNTIILGENFINTIKSSLLENLFVELYLPLLISYLFQHKVHLFQYFLFHQELLDLYYE